MEQNLSNDYALSPLSLVFHPSFWALERTYRAHSYIPTQPLGHVYWIGLRIGVCVQWTEAMSLRETCGQAAAQMGIQLPCSVPDLRLLPDLNLIVHHEAFRRLQPVSYPDGTSLDEVERGGRRYGLYMEGSWWTDWRLYGNNIPFDLAGVISCGADEIRIPHQEEYAPWKRLSELLVPILGPMNRYWYMRWRRPYGVHVFYTDSGEVRSVYLGDPCDVIKLTTEEIRAKVPWELLERLRQTKQNEDQCVPPGQGKGLAIVPSDS